MSSSINFRNCHTPVKVLFATIFATLVIMSIFLLEELRTVSKAENQLKEIAEFVRLMKLQNLERFPTKGIEPIPKDFFSDRLYIHTKSYLDPWGNIIQIDYSAETIWMKGDSPSFWRRFGHSFKESFSSSSGGEKKVENSTFFLNSGATVTK